MPAKQASHGWACSKCGTTARRTKERECERGGVCAWKRVKPKDEGTGATIEEGITYASDVAARSQESAFDLNRDQGPHDELGPVPRAPTPQEVADAERRTRAVRAITELREAEELLASVKQRVKRAKREHQDALYCLAGVGGVE